MIYFMEVAKIAERIRKICQIPMLPLEQQKVVDKTFAKMLYEDNWAVKCHGRGICIVSDLLKSEYVLIEYYNIALRQF